MKKQTGAAVERTLSLVRDVLGEIPVRGELETARDALIALAAQRELWVTDEFPAPVGDERQARYLIAQDHPDGLTLYLNVMRPGKQIPPHNHTTWACIAAVEGGETNTIYERTDDGSRPGVAEIHVSKVIEVEPGTGIALMPDDIHSVLIGGDQTIRHLHMYGRPLENLDRRLTFDPEKKTCRIMDIGVKTRR